VTDEKGLSALGLPGRAVRHAGGQHPKVATLFYAYERSPLGPEVWGLDLVSWLVGLSIDLCAALTTWAAMNKFAESRKRRDLMPSAVIILFCSGLSIVANYEDAATLRPEQYAVVSIFTHPALLINPVLISSPPMLVLLLIPLVPAVLARARVKTVEEIAAETAQQIALINAKAELKETKARNNAKVRQAQLGGLADSACLLMKRAGIAKEAQLDGHDVLPLPETDSEPEPLPEQSADLSTSGIFELPGHQVSRAMWNLMSLKQRVQQSGLITVPEVAEVLDVSQPSARELASGVRDGDQPALPGRNGVGYKALIDALYDHRTNSSLGQAQKLEKALGVRKRKQGPGDPA
jgi:hypothetical protein